VQTCAAADDFKPLFDGQSLAGWRVLPGGKWEVVDGAIVGTNEASEQRHGQLISEREYDNFVVRFKFQAIDGNSGFYFRAQQVDDPVAVKGFQAEIDSAGNDIGGLYETLGRAWVARPAAETVKACFRPKDWNEMTVTAIDGDIKVEVNGKETTRLEKDPSPRRGKLALQLHGGQKMLVRFKDFEIKVLPAAEAQP
jgi:hypothetical protein